MLRRLITQLGLPAIAGLSLLLVGGPAKASEQGWPILGRNWSYYGASYPTVTASSVPEYTTASPAFYGSYAPEYYATYPTRTPQPWGYYSSASLENYYGSLTTPGYYGATSREGYYGSLTANAPMERPILVNLRLPSDAKVWFNGSPTNQTGTMRSFKSPPVAAGQNYVYDIRIQWKQDGKNRTQTRRINVEAGDVINLTMGTRVE
jgi:uncharacterized protein (TIGR03000 family)